MLVLQKQIRDQKWPDCPWVFFRHGKRIKDLRGAWEEAGNRAGLWNDEADKPKHIFTTCAAQGQGTWCGQECPSAW